jgi:hypothetical protein
LEIVKIIVKDESEVMKCPSFFQSPLLIAAAISGEEHLPIAKYFLSVGCPVPTPNLVKEYDAIAIAIFDRDF